MHLNSRRFDLSPWLIHFLRKVAPDRLADALDAAEDDES
jgi:hypothetical protein